MRLLCNSNFSMDNCIFSETVVNLVENNSSKRGKDMGNKYDSLKLENQLCFPLYACAKEIVKRYKPFLEEIELTYTQYITMMVLWEHRQMNVKELGNYLYLDSGTLTPVLKKLEQKGYLTRKRNEKDERVLDVAITNDGEKLKEKAVEIPAKIGGCVALEPADAIKLYEILQKLLGSFKMEA